MNIRWLKLTFETVKTLLLFNIVEEVITKNMACCFFSHGRDYSKALMSDPFTTRQGSCEPFHPQKMLESLFNIPQSTKHEPKTMSWRNVAKKMQSLGIDASSSSGEGSHPEIFGIFTILYLF